MQKLTYIASLFSYISLSCALFVDYPEKSTNLFSHTNLKNINQPSSLPSKTRPFFIMGEEVRTPAFISTNGFIDFVGSHFLTPTLNESPFRIIAPFCKELTYSKQHLSQITQQIENDYFVITWKNMQDAKEPNRFYTFQMIWFDKTSRIYGIEFEKDDIVFFYEEPKNIFAIPNTNESIPTIGIGNQHNYQHLKYEDLKRPFSKTISLPHTYVRLRWDGEKYNIFIPQTPHLLVSPSSYENINAVLFDHLTDQSITYQKASFPSKERPFYFNGIKIEVPFDIQRNGHLHIRKKDSVFEENAIDEISTISPFEMPLIIDPDRKGFVMETCNKDYWAFTWQNLKDQNFDNRFYTFQTIFFTNETNIDSKIFLPGDIVFAFENRCEGQIFLPSPVPVCQIELFSKERIFSPRSFYGQFHNLLTLPAKYILYRWNTLAEKYDVFHVD